MVVLRAKKYGGYYINSDNNITFVFLKDVTEGADDQGLPTDIARLLRQIIPDQVIINESYNLKHLKPPQKLCSGTILDVSSVSKGNIVRKSKNFEINNYSMRVHRPIQRTQSLVPQRRQQASCCNGENSIRRTHSNLFLSTR